MMHCGIAVYKALSVFFSFALLGCEDTYTKNKDVVAVFSQ